MKASPPPADLPMVEFNPARDIHHCAACDKWVSDGDWILHERYDAFARSLGPVERLPEWGDFPGGVPPKDRFGCAHCGRRVHPVERRHCRCPRDRSGRPI